MNVEKTDKVKYPINEFKKRGRLVLTNEILAQIFFLHSSVGSTEWSGILLYEVVSGSPADIDNFVLKAKHIFLMDIGSTGYTEYETDGDIVDIYDKIEGAMDMKIGQIHTHHTMSTSFSTTDTDELNDNVDKHNYYLSLIVNFSGLYTAKVAFLMDRKTTSKISYTDDSGNIVEFTDDETEKNMGIIPMTIVMDYADKFFYDRLADVRRSKEEKEKKSKEKPLYNMKSLGGGKKHTKGQETYLSWNTSGARVPTPWTMSDKEVEFLLSQVISISSDLSDTRNTYQILNALADNAKEDVTFDDLYKQYLGAAIQGIMELFFETPIGIHGKKYVISEFIPLLKRHQSTKRLKKMIEVIFEVFTDFLNDGNYRKQSKEVTPEELEEEIKKFK